MKIFPDRSFSAVGKIAERIGKSIKETAEGIIDIANATMEKAIRVISIERGFDPRNFSLFCFGGAGGMHAIDIAAHLNMPQVIVPKNAGVLSALGLLLADSIKDYSKSMLENIDGVEKARLDLLFSQLIKKSQGDMKKEGFHQSRIRLFPSLDLRYSGQSYEITLPYRHQDNEKMASDFHQAHKKMYSYYHPDRPVEIVNIRLKAVGLTKKIKIKENGIQKSDPGQALFCCQDLVYGHKTHRALVYKRSLLECGNQIPGPALIVDTESTTVLPPGWKLRVDGWMNLIIQRT